jgi:hypothetical protein
MCISLYFYMYMLHETDAAGQVIMNVATRSPVCWILKCASREGVTAHTLAVSMVQRRINDTQEDTFLATATPTPTLCVSLSLCHTNHTSIIYIYNHILCIYTYIYILHETDAAGQVIMNVATRSPVCWILKCASREGVTAHTLAVGMVQRRINDTQEDTFLATATPTPTLCASLSLCHTNHTSII